MRAKRSILTHMATSVSSEEALVRSRAWPGAILVGVVLLGGALWIAIASWGGTGEYPACPADVTGYSGSCAVGSELYRYEAGQLCGRGSLHDGEPNWLDGGPCL